MSIYSSEYTKTHTFYNENSRFWTETVFSVIFSISISKYIADSNILCRCKHLLDLIMVLDCLGVRRTMQEDFFKRLYIRTFSRLSIM